MALTVRISERAITRIVAAAVASVPGTISHSAGIDRLTGRKFPRYDVQLDELQGTVSIETFIAVTWPSPVVKVAEAVRDAVRMHVETFTGLTVSQVNVVVGPVVHTGLRVTADQLALSPPPTASIRVRSTPVTSVSMPVAPRPLRPIVIWRAPR
ncbi:Asp23/Gls24 family envelope stress response protein [Corynebacterium epidermidicanis]|uniref:Asp23 family n=1 Tax=Corynebacterium epidermidicanis TaxID=1050174 RepID=A0A0G3GTV6_9CORY|nr:Asp23/Gls24 family envelope stress response protein [Corynebacterium epidermidicanis]AKK02262.1 hypothetical protein CEPID_01905 [Corynebacterium epidermidicanis]